ncbi:NAD-dependent epimerase/dehydratase family protein [Ferribacterium limneticum]|uniref:NAD-dependent epimerase/dehydratase family protein n=1 Tax=Ferribacterium limneticum TaxID=76259 RepID=UPI001CFB8916|nr:NAD(P)-dependent oxidoreductase [Ferribacterium limneticum]UCV28971.1 NAD(P)-dependent oxidoreductase [Ferribacterium limneticum]UCV32889.1 NAD(P)-dependent oxidoreductase [Ferribacterium limneticum]
MRVVVTGASGFLGSVIARSLTYAGVSTLRVSRQDIPGFLQVAKYADSPLGDVLIHLAEINNRSRVNQLSVEYEHEASSTLHALLKKGYGKVIYASSSVIYGDGLCTPHIESEPVSAIDTYTRVKLASEQSVLSCGGVVVRLANIYGPSMATVNVLSHIFGQLDQNGPIKLQDTSPVRDFIWVEDAAEVIIKMATQQAQGVFNVGTGVGTSIGELARMLLEEAKQSQRQIVSTQPAAKPSCIVLDITKTKQYLYWQPSVLLNEGLRRLVSRQRGMEHT